MTEEEKQALRERREREARDAQNFPEEMGGGENICLSCE